MLFGLHPLDLCVFAVFLVANLWIGLRASRGIHTSEEFFIGKRQFSWVYMLFHGFGAATHSDQTEQVAGKAVVHGVPGAWSQLFWIFLTPFYWLLAPIFRRLRMVTTGEYFALRYGTGIGALYAVVGAAVQVANLGLLLKGSAVLIEAMTRGAVTQPFAILLMTALFLSYSVTGGLTAAIVTDLLQGSVIFVLSFLLIPFVLGAAGGLGGLHRKLPPAAFELSGGEEWHMGSVLVFALGGLVGIVTQPHVMANCAAGATEWEGRIGFTFGNFSKRLCTVAWMLIGLCGAVLYPELRTAGEAAAEGVFGRAVVDYLPVGLSGLMLACVTTANLSACDVFLVSAAGLLTRSVYRPFLGKGRNEARELLVGRVLSVVVVAAGVATSFILPSIHKGFLWFLSIATWTGVAWWLGLLWRGANRGGALLSIFATAGVDLAMWALGAAPVVRTPCAIGAGLLAGILGSLVSPPEDPARTGELHARLVTPIGEPVPRPEDVPASRRSRWAMLAPLRGTVQGFVLAWVLVAMILAGTWLVFHVR
jgi:Na+/proline symporter